jgi:hypothetical protein
MNCTHVASVTCLPVIGLGNMLDFGPSKKGDPVQAVAFSQFETFLFHDLIPIDYEKYIKKGPRKIERVP